MASQDLSMHDLVHDLASLIIANESLVLDCTDKRKWKKTRYCRHAQLINCKNKCKVFKDLPSKIRSLHFRDSGNVQLKAKAFSQSKYIRVLDLSGCSVEGQPTPSSIVLPTSIHQLKLLRYLDVTGLPITSLPNTFHTLRNMQTLILSNCSLETLPENISRFKKLCYLDLSSNINLKKLPTSLGELSDLSFLNISGCFLLQELPESICELANLWHLDMSKCCALEKLPDKFGSLHKLIFLNLSYCCKLTKLPTNVSLESLEHMNLSSCHELENLPEVFGNLSKLCYLNLSGCYKIGMLPESFCQLEYLKDLDVSDCHNLTELPSCFGNLSELESLNLTSCPKLQRLPESFHKLIKLKHLNLSHCTSLKRLPSLFADLNLQILDISCAALEDLPDSICYMTSLTQLLVMSGHPKVVEKAKAVRKSLNFPGIVLHTVHEMDSERFSSILDLAQLTCNELSILHLENVKHPDDGKRANLRDKSELQLLGLSWDLKGHDLPEMENDAQEGKCVLESLVPPRTLENFVLDGYMSKEFPNWMSHISYYLPSLTYLSLSDLGTCENLPPFGQLPNLRSICMHNIPNIKKIGHEFYGEGGTCRKLREIKLESMENLEEWWTTTSGAESENFCIPDILKLQLKDCPKLKFLPYPPRSMRWLLNNSDEVLPEHGFGSLSSAIFPFAMKIENCNFSPAEWDRLQHLSTLEWLQVSSCRVSRGLTDVIGCFSSLRGLKLSFLKDLETLPEWLGHFKSLEVVHIHDCCKVTFLPESMKNLTTLKHLILVTCQVLNALPEWLGHLTSLETIIIAECGSLATRLPESMKNLISLKKLVLSGCKEVEILPEWLGQLLSLREIYFSCNPKVTSLPESIQYLTALMELRIRYCPRLIRRCQGEDAYKISHIPTVILDNKRYKGDIGVGEHSFGLSCLISPSRPLNSFVLDRFAHQAS